MRCVQCGRSAIFSTKNNHKRRSDSEHELCRQCFVSLSQRVKAKRLSRQMPRFPPLSTLLLAAGILDFEMEREPDKRAGTVSKADLLSNG